MYKNIMLYYFNYNIFNLLLINDIKILHFVLNIFD
jgi:hypothetical protein